MEGLSLARGGGGSWAWGQSLQWSDPPVLHPQVLSMSSLRPSAGWVGALEPTHWPCVCSTSPSTNAGHTDILDKTGAKSLPSFFGLAGDTQLKTNNSTKYEKWRWPLGCITSCHPAVPTQTSSAGLDHSTIDLGRQDT